LEIWNAANTAREAGADLRAVTVWSLLGAYDWTSLLTRVENRYESGAFDLRGGRPRATAVAHLARQLAEGADLQHPVLASPGWWRRPARLVYPPVAVVDAPKPSFASQLRATGSRGGRPLLITGAGGKLGRAFERLCRLRGLEHVVLTREKLDIASPEAVAEALERHQPWAVVNAAGFEHVDHAESNRTACFRSNLEGPKQLALACAERAIPLVTFSSDQVFDGSRRRYYVESDGVRPLNTYGRSKAEAERAVLRRHAGALIVRAGALFGPWDESNFVTGTLNRLAAGETLMAPDDAVVSPTYIPDLVHAALDLLIDGEHGLWHLANEGETDWYRLVKRAASLAGISTRRLAGRSMPELGYCAPRPLYSALGTERAAMLPSLDKALRSYIQDRSEAGGAWN
jgi:dTDP-4-dehydrorhamnose reductase